MTKIDLTLIIRMQYSLRVFWCAAVRMWVLELEQ